MTWASHGPRGLCEGQTRLIGWPWVTAFALWLAPGAPSARDSLILVLFTTVTITAQGVAAWGPASQGDPTLPPRAVGQFQSRRQAPGLRLSHWDRAPDWPVLGIWWGLTRRPRESAWGLVRERQGGLFGSDSGGPERGIGIELNRSFREESGALEGESGP